MNNFAFYALIGFLLLCSVATANDRISVIVVVEDTERELWTEKFRGLSDEENGPDFSAKAADLISDPRSRLASFGKTLELAGLEELRYSFAASAIMGWCDPDDLAKFWKIPGVVDVYEDQVLDSLMNVSVPSLLPESFHNANIRGQLSGFEVGILDAGIDASHPAFSGIDIRYHIDHTNALSDANYDDSSVNPDDLTFGGHGTHIAGIIAGRSSPTWESYTGVAPGTPRIYNLKSGFRRSNSDLAGLYFSDALDNIDWGIFQASDDIDSLNFSWGVTATADDSGLARYFDAVVADLNIPVAVAAGNSGPSAATVTDPGIAWNVITVGSVNDANTVLRSDDNVTGSSARGPTLGGRKKPDLVAPGFIIASPTNLWETNLDFLSISGTSFSAPHAMGAVQLVMDFFGPGVSPLQVKALLIASASPGSFFDSGASIEWDPEWGWGYINLDRAYDYRNNVYLNSVNPAGSSGDYKLYRGPMEPVQRAALVWNRHVNYVTGGGQPSTAGSLNDLNMRIYDHANNTTLDSSTSGIDNVEVVSITAQEYESVIKVYAADSAFSRVSSETYALSTPPGFTFPQNLPDPEATVFVIPGEPYRLFAILENTGDFNAHNITADLNLPAGVDLVSGLENNYLGTLTRNSGQKRILEWSVDSEEPLSGNATVNLSSSSYGEIFTGSRTVSLDGQPGGLLVSIEVSNSLPLANEPVELTATVQNNTASFVSSGSVVLETESGVTLISGDAEQSFSSLGSNDETTISWTVSISDPGVLKRFLALGEAMTAGGAGLFGGDSVTVGTALTSNENILEIQAIAPEQVSPGTGLTVNLSITNKGEVPVSGITAQLVADSNFILASGSEVQPVPDLNPGESIETGRWLYLTPGTATVGDFVFHVDVDYEKNVSVPFQVGVGREIPDPAEFATTLKDNPLLQAWTGTSDNDPVGLDCLPDGRIVFHNAQPGNRNSHQAVVMFDPNLKATDALQVLATQTQLQAALNTGETVSVADIASNGDGDIFILTRIIRNTENDPVALLKIGNIENVGYTAPLPVLPPGSPPLGLQAIANDSGCSMEWDMSSNRLLILSDNGDTSDDTTGNGLHEFLPESGEFILIASFADLSLGLQPAPRPGIDPIGFSSLTVDNMGNAYCVNIGGIGGNRGDIVVFSSDGNTSLYADESELLSVLPANYPESEVRLQWNQVTRTLGILVTDNNQIATGETLLAEWNPQLGEIESIATRGQLLTATGSGQLLNFGQALETDRMGSWLLWSASDNETLLRVNSVIPVIDCMVIY